MSKKRLAAAVLCVALVAGAFSGCGKQQQEEEITQDTQQGNHVAAETELPDMGYVAEEVKLPDMGEEWVIKQLFTVEDELHLLAAAQEGEATILREWQQEEEEFVDVTQDWLLSLQLPCDIGADMQLMQEKSGTQYLHVRFVNEESVFQSKLWRGNGSEAIEITPQKWSVPNQTWGGYEYIQGIAALDTGTLSAISSTAIDMISGEDGSILESESVTTGYGETMLSDGENIYLTTYGNSGGIDGIEVRPGGSGKDTAKISLPISSIGGVSCCVGEDGTLVAAGGEGIFRYNAATEEWDKLMEGTRTDFALVTCWCIGMVVKEDGSVYALFRQEDGATRLVRHYYNPDAVDEVQITLKLYTVWESSLLQQAAVMYHREHPEVLITVDYVYALGDRYSGKTPDYEQVFQSLNTMLMGSDAPDILVMDHLNVNSYAEKGLLLDIDDIIAPMEQSGELFSNMTSAYRQEDGKRYVVPLQFGFVMGVGRDISAENMQSLEALADYLKSQSDNYMGPMTASELVDQFYPYFCGDIVKGKELDRETLGKILEYLKVIAENSGIVDAHRDGERKYNMWNLASKAKLAYTECDGFYDSWNPIAMMEYIGGDFAAYENSFVPFIQMGISTKSEYQETAKDFLQFALSKDVQVTETYGNFPINQAAFEQQGAADRSDIGSVTGIETDAGAEMFEILQYSQEITQRIFELCGQLDRPVVEDAKIREELIAALPGYLDGSRTLEETLDSIEGGLRMYLAE